MLYVCVAQCYSAAVGTSDTELCGIFSECLSLSRVYKYLCVAQIMQVCMYMCECAFTCPMQSDRTLWSDVHFTDMYFMSVALSALLCCTAALCLLSWTAPMGAAPRRFRQPECSSQSELRNVFVFSVYSVYPGVLHAQVYTCITVSHISIGLRIKLIGLADFRPSWHITDGVWHIGNSCFPEHLAHPRANKITALLAHIQFIY